MAATRDGRTCGEKLMKTISILVVALVFCATGLVRAASLDDANRDFAGGQYHAATLGFQAVLAESGYSAPVLFDLGNSYYREGNFPQAILAYQRARWLSPNDPEVTANLQLAQKQAGIADAAPQTYEKLTGLLSASGWGWLACATWTLLCVSLLARMAVPQRRSVFTFCAVLSIFVLIDSIAAIALSSDPLHQAVVIDKNASALISPFPSAQTVFSPSPGETLTVQKSYDDFLLVKDSAGHTGWISKMQITPIVPPAAG